MSFSRGKSVARHRHPVVVVDTGCSCGRSKLSSFVASQQPKPNRVPPNSPEPFSTTASTPSSSHWEAASLIATTSSPPSTPTEESPNTSRRGGRRSKRAVGDGVAVVKESSDPYVDFRESMLAMIVEEEMEAWEDLRRLLHRFLALNDPAHHRLVLRAFADVCAAAFRPSPAPWR